MYIYAGVYEILGWFSIGLERQTTMGGHAK